MESLPGPAALPPGNNLPPVRQPRASQFFRKGEHTMKEYIQPEVELVKFTSEVVTGSIGTGTGSSKKRAEQAAARMAIEKLFPNQ